MASNYFNLPRPSVGNQRVDFAPVNNALETYQRAAQNNALMEQRQQEIDYRQQRDARQDQRQATQDDRQQVEWFGKQALAIDRLQGPQRATAWQRLIARHPNAAGLSPDYMDPMKGPGMVAAEAGQWRDPREDRLKDLELQYKQAQIGKLQADAQDTGSAYGKSGQVFQDPQSGQFYSVQFGADGSRKIEPLAVEGKNLTPSRGVGVVGDAVYDKATGGTVRNVGAEIERGEFAKGRGQDNADFVAKYPKVETSYKSFVNKTNNVIGVIDRAIASVAPNTTGWGGLLASMPDSDARELQGDLNTIRANLAFGELQDMRANNPSGAGLGAVTERELDLLSSTQGSLEQLQSGVRVKENLQLIKSNLSEIKKLRDEAYATDQARYQSLLGAPQQPTQARPDPLGLFGGS